MSNELCAHCGGQKESRNPTGRCDHLRWPDNLTDEAKIANGYAVVKVTQWQHYSVTGMREGWCVMWSDSRQRYEIQRDDEWSVFRCDEDAEAFVRQRAVDGSAPHRAAIAVVDGSLCA